MPPGKFSILDSLFGCILRYLRMTRSDLRLLLHSQVEFSATVPAKMHHKQWTSSAMTSKIKNGSDSGGTFLKKVTKTAIFC